MNFLKGLFGGDQQEDNKSVNQEGGSLLEMMESEHGVLIPKALASHWKDIKKTCRETVKIGATPNDNLTMRESKFGHYPCIPRNFDFPKDKEGNYMFPLAQINFSEVPKLKGFPEKGYLQFYIKTNDSYGLSFDNDVPSDFKVLFFEESEVTDIEDDFTFLKDLLVNEYTPVYCPHSLAFEHRHEYVGLGDYHADRNKSFNLDKLLKEHEAVADKLESTIYEIFQSTGNKIGGYAFFTQDDPRNYNEDIQEYQLLFQMDSGDKIMWGDVGVANFFIHPNQLSKKDFSNVFYNWDCC